MGNSQRLRKEGNAEMNKVLAMRPCLAKIIQKVGILRYVEYPENHLQLADNAFCIDYTDTCSSKQVHCRPKANVRNVVLLLIDVKICWTSAVKLL